jgi:hypothetical protein
MMTRRDLAELVLRVSSAQVTQVDARLLCEELITVRADLAQLDAENDRLRTALDRALEEQAEARAAAQLALCAAAALRPGRPA